MLPGRGTDNKTRPRNVCLETTTLQLGVHNWRVPFSFYIYFLYYLLSTQIASAQRTSTDAQVFLQPPREAQKLSLRSTKLDTNWTLPPNASFSCVAGTLHGDAKQTTMLWKLKYFHNLSYIHFCMSFISYFNRRLSLCGYQKQRFVLTDDTSWTVCEHNSHSITKTRTKGQLMSTRHKHFLFSLP